MKNLNRQFFGSDRVLNVLKPIMQLFLSKLSLYFLAFNLLLTSQVKSQAFINGSFENTTSPVACNYNLSNLAFNGFMANTNAYGGGQEVDIMIAGCFNPSVPDGIRSIGLAGFVQDEVALELSAPLIVGNSYTISFWAYGNVDFAPVGDIEVGESTVNNNFGTLIYSASVIANTWTQFTFSFIATNNSTWITVKNSPGFTHWNHVDNFQFVNICDPSWTTSSLCAADPVTNLAALITGDIGGTWSGTGVTGDMFDPAAGTQSITYTAPGGCFSTQTIVVTPIADATWTIPTGLCDTDPSIDLNTFITGTIGGTWSGTGVIGSDFNPAAGTQNITYTVGTGLCQDLITQTITIGAGSNPAWTAISLCSSDTPIDLTGQITGDPGGLWSGTGITGSTFDPANGTQTITYTVGVCTPGLVQTINVYDPAVSITSTDILCAGENSGLATANLTGGSGNYTYLWSNGQTTQTLNGLVAGTYTVDVTDADGGCTVSAVVTITEPTAITATLSATPACKPDLGAASVSAVGGTGAYSYAWSSGATSSLITDLDSNMYAVAVTDGNGCVFVDSIEVQVFSNVAATTINDTTIDAGSCLRLDAWGGDSYNWTPDDALTFSDIQDPIACPEINTEYCVSVSDINGCTDLACVKISIEINCGEVFVPSAFSPNNDGENDLECVYSNCFQGFYFEIYNRWGEKVFETSDKNICWDGTWKGKELNSAVFVYRLEGILINGEQVSKKGNISLIR
jgi:gliding motility-associated-like protein